MLLIDDILVYPAKGLLWIFEEIRDAAMQELEAEAESITAELQQLYANLESGQITEEEFDQREEILLDRLDQIQESGALDEENEENMNENEEENDDGDE